MSIHKIDEKYQKNQHSYYHHENCYKMPKKTQNHDSTGGHPSRNRHGKQIYFF